MKKVLLTLIASISIFGFAGIAFALPYYQNTESLLPGITDKYNIGTSSPSLLEYNNIFVKNITVSGTCTGCGGSSGGAAYPFPLTGNATSTLTQFNGGVTAFASSTIGDTTQAGGLTVSGGATTTGNAYIGGNLGIGIQAPGTPLDVLGNIRSASSLTDSTNKAFRFLDRNYINSQNDFLLVFGQSKSTGNTLIFGGGQTGNTAASAISFFTGAGNNTDTGTSRMTIDSTGNVGIGTTTPGTLLSIGATGTGVNFVDNGTTTFSGKGINLQNGGCFAIAGVCLTSGSSGNAFSYLFPSNATTTVLTFSNGASIPKLTNLTDNGLVKTSGGDGTLSIDTSTYVTFAYPFPNILGGGNATSSLVGFSGGYLATASSTHTALTNFPSGIWNAAGSVGIGTTTPANKLDVYDNTAIAQLRLESAGSGTGVIYVNAPSRNNWYMGLQNNVDNGFEITPSTAVNGFTFSTPVFCMLQTGNVGIGSGACPTPGNLLSVAKNQNAATSLQVQNTNGSGSAGTSITLNNGSFNSYFEMQGTGVATSSYLKPNGADFRNDGQGIDFAATRADGALTFWTGGANQRMVIASNGNVGIGSTTPGSLFSVGNNGTGTNFFDNATTTKNGVGGYNIAQGCFSIVGVCLTQNAGTVTSVTASTPNSTLSLGGTNPITSSGTISFDLNLGHSNIWTVLQQFTGNASTTQLSVPQNAYFGSTGTTTITNAGFIGIGTSTPFAALSLDRQNGFASSTIAVNEYNYGSATSTSALIDCRSATDTHYRIGTSATTLQLNAASLIPGQKCIVIIENPNAAAGALTWTTTSGAILLWAGGTTPTQTTTANKMDVWSFLATTGSSTKAILGAQSANF